MSQPLHVTVGPEHGDCIGTSLLALQAAVERVSSHGGGTVEVLPGTWHMNNALDLPLILSDAITVEAWVSTDADGLESKGYYGAVADGRYITFMPRRDSENFHSRIQASDIEITIARLAAGAAVFPGIVKLARVSDSARDSDWIRTQHEEVKTT